MSRKLIKKAQHYQIDYFSAGSWWRSSKLFDDKSKAKKYIKQAGNHHEKYRVVSVETRVYEVK